jgi:hypothetical protein
MERMAKETKSWKEYNTLPSLWHQISVGNIKFLSSIILLGVDLLSMYFEDCLWNHIQLFCGMNRLIYSIHLQWHITQTSKFPHLELLLGLEYYSIHILRQHCPVAITIYVKHNLKYALNIIAKLYEDKVALDKRKNVP